MKRHVCLLSKFECAIYSIWLYWLFHLDVAFGFVPIHRMEITDFVRGHARTAVNFAVQSDWAKIKKIYLPLEIRQQIQRKTKQVYVLCI